MRPDLSNLDMGGPATNRDIRRVAHGYEPRRQATMAAFAKELAEGNRRLGLCNARNYGVRCGGSGCGFFQCIELARVSSLSL